MPTGLTEPRKQQIEKTATELFRLKGYAATSMRDLAQELNMEAASLYAHFKSKEEMLQNICFKMADNFFEALEKVASKNAGPGTKLKMAIVEHVKVVIHNPGASAVFLNEWKHLSEPYLSRFVKLRERYEMSFSNIIKEGTKAGDFKELDEKFTTKFILSSLNWIHSWYKPSGKLTPDETGRQLAHLLISGLENTNYSLNKN